MQKSFCKTCGVPLTNEVNEDMSEEQVREVCGDAGDAEMVLRWRNSVHPINIRVLDSKVGDEGWSWDEMVKELKVRRGDGWNMIKPGYVNP